MLPLLSSIFLGWSLGSNDAANVFGTAVTSKMVKFTTAVILCCIFVVLGAVSGGYEGISTLGSLTSQSLFTAGVSSLAAAITVTIMTFLKLPVSTSQGVVGSIIGIGIMQNQLNLSGLGKVVICWIGTPVGALIISIILYLSLAKIINKIWLNAFQYDVVLRVLLIVSGCYGAYALGANNVANVTGVFVSAGFLTPLSAVLIGSLSICFGIATFSKRVMTKVGKGIIKLDAFSAFIVVLAESITVHIYAIIGVPVSTSQAIIGAVVGVGLIKQIDAVNFKALSGILTGWMLTPFIACIISIAIYFISNLKYVG